MSRRFREEVTLTVRQYSTVNKHEESTEKSAMIAVEALDDSVEGAGQLLATIWRNLSEDLLMLRAWRSDNLTLCCLNCNKQFSRHDKIGLFCPE